jgi:hypothetical protein
MSSEPLYHFTCAHGYHDIGHSGVCLLRPSPHPFLQQRLLWLTTEAKPDRHASGLGSSIARCDRMQFRYVVDDRSVCQPWLQSPQRATAPRSAVEDLESEGDPEHWWVSDRIVRARFDRGWQP